ncbi:hypothetical protein MRX96_020777 [Rhipicephalus microplus]
MSRPLLTAASSSYIPASAGVFQPMSVGPKTLPLGPSMLAPHGGPSSGIPFQGSQAPVNLHEEMGASARAPNRLSGYRAQDDADQVATAVSD